MAASHLTRLQPDFDARLDGYKQISDLVKAKTDLFVTEERQMPRENRIIYPSGKMTFYMSFSKNFAEIRSHRWKQEFTDRRVAIFNPFNKSDL